MTRKRLAYLTKRWDVVDHFICWEFNITRSAESDLITPEQD